MGLCYDLASINDDCPQCPYGQANNMQFTLSGIINDSCSDCNVLNTTFTLPLQVGQCQWFLDNGGFICGADLIIWSLTWRSEDNRWDLRGLFGDSSVCEGTYTGAVKYICSEFDFDCLGSSIMTLLCYNGTCSGWPATLTITGV